MKSTESSKFGAHSRLVDSRRRISCGRKGKRKSRKGRKDNERPEGKRAGKTKRTRSK